MPRIANSTQPLAGNAAWDSGALEPGLADEITGSVFADQPGTLFVEQSGDGTNWDVSTSYSIPANDGSGFDEKVLLPYVRVRYVNGATPNTVFRLHARMISAGPR